MGEADESAGRHRDRERSSPHGERHRHRRGDDRDRDHRKKKRRRDDKDDEDRERRHRHRRDSERREKSPEKKSLADELADDFDEDMWEEKRKEPAVNKVERPLWMTGEKDGEDGSIDHFSALLGALPPKQKKQPVEKPKPEEAIMNHPRQLNTALRDPKPEIRVEEEDDDGGYKPPTWTIGDAGSSWRMMKLKNLYAAAKDSMRPVEEVAIERMGSLQAFDEAREEEMELERRNRDRRGDGIMKVKVTGELYAQRLAKERKHARRDEATASNEIPLAPQSIPVATTEPPVTQSDLNKLQAAVLRAEMMSSPDLEKLRQEYSELVDKFNTQPSQAEIIQLPSSHSQLVAHLSREHSLSSNEMTIEDMVKEERAAKRSSNVERIIRDKQYRNDLDYLDENAEKLATVTKRKEADLKNLTIQEYQKQQRIMEKCPLCFKEDGSGKGPLAPVISLGTRTYLSLPTEPELTKDGSMIVPLRHARNLADCDDDEWEEIRNFMKCLIQLYSSRNQSVLFYEDASHPSLHRHPALIAIPMAHNPFTQAPAYFTQALNTAESEWATHRPIIRTDAPELGKWGFRKRIAKEAPYFHVWFGLEGGMGHVVEDEDRWGNGELWVRSILGGGLLGINRSVWGRMGRWTGYDERVIGFRKKWDKFDWTKALAMQEGS